MDSTTARVTGSIKVMLFPLVFAVKTAGMVDALAAVVPAALVLVEGVAFAAVLGVVAAAEVAAADGEAATTDELAAGLVAAAGVVPAAGEAVLLAGAPQATARTRAKPNAPDSLSRLRDLAFSSIGLKFLLSFPTSTPN